MKPSLVRRSLSIAALFTLSPVALAQDEGWMRPLDGNSLEAWHGDGIHWTLTDGELVGRSTAELPLKASTYLVWQGDMPADFELECQWQIHGGNSGIQYRSQVVDGQTDMAGFQADMDADNSYTGVLYEGLGRSLMSARGESVEWNPSGRKLLATSPAPERLRAAIRDGEWNEYRIEARGTRVRHWINGLLMSDVTDGDASRFRRDGQMAIQLHAGPPMEVRYRDMKVRAIRSAPPASALSVPDGFGAELLVSAQPGQGSWVAMALAPDGRLLVSPQQGPLMWIDLPGAVDGTPLSVSPLKLPVGLAEPDGPIGSSQGLCFAHDALFVSCPHEVQGGGGLWRVRDTDGDGVWEDAERIFEYGDGGEHGPHAVIAGPDGFLYVVLGNHVAVPRAVTGAGSPIGPWHEELLGEREWDPRGHAVGITAPGGVILRMDPDGQQAEIFACGMRNAYDMAFNEQGELFTYDSDMEWDIGAPWYRFPKVLHLTRGADFGWRSGSANPPSWFADIRPMICDTDFSSPTGMASGHETNFPEPWRSMIFIGDWSYGRILAVELESDGASFKGAWKPFITGRPMPVADFCVGSDGAMLVLTGGRGVQSGVYRVAWTGSAPAPLNAGPDASKPPRERRRKLESLMRPLEPDEFESLFPAMLGEMGDDDPAIRFAARLALEHQPIGQWRSTLLAEERPRARIEAALALARCGDDADAVAAVALVAPLLTTPPDSAGDEAAQLAALRTISVALARHPQAAGPIWEIALAPVMACYPAQEWKCDRLASELLAQSGSESFVELTMSALEATRDRAERMWFAFILRNVKVGWNESLCRRYFTALDGLSAQGGGFSLEGFLRVIRADALQAFGAKCGDASTPLPIAEPAAARAVLATVRPPVHNWTVADLADNADADWNSSAPRGDAARGRQVFMEASCALCHRVGGDGATTGPDLTGAGGRYAATDLLDAILNPSGVVSDQWQDSLIELTDGGIVVGRIVSDDGTTMTVATNPLGPERESISRASVAKIEPLPTSSMPPGLLDTRSEQEILDLLAYLRSARR